MIDGGITTTAVLCLALNAYHEARGEGAAGVHAVTNVVMNRVADTRWPDDPCAVVYDADQFSWTNAGPLHVDAERLLDMKEMVVDALMLPDSTGGATHYHADYVAPFWAAHYPITEEIGAHIFYKAPIGL